MSLILAMVGRVLKGCLAMGECYSLNCLGSECTLPVCHVIRQVYCIPQFAYRKVWRETWAMNDTHMNVCVQLHPFMTFLGPLWILQQLQFHWGWGALCWATLRSSSPTRKPSARRDLPGHSGTSKRSILWDSFWYLLEQLSSQPLPHLGWLRGHHSDISGYEAMILCIFIKVLKFNFQF